MERKFRVIKPTGEFAIKESEIFIDSSSIQINLENPQDKTPVYFVERETEDDFYFVDKNNEIIVFSNDGKSCKRIGVSQFEKTGLKVGDIISLDKMRYLLNEVSLCVYSFLQEITPTEDNLRKALKILDENFVGNYGYVLNYKMFYKYDGKDDWLKNNICAKQYEISEKYYEAGYNIDPECCEICKKADKVPYEEKFYYEYGYYESEDDTEPEIHLSKEEYDILKSLEEENEN